MANTRKKVTKTASKSKPVVDVSPPGVASTTSRAIITKHQVMPDPMVTAQPGGEAGPATAPPVKRNKVVIKPLHDVDRDGLLDVASGTKLSVPTDVTTAPALPASAKTTFIDDQIKKAAGRQATVSQEKPIVTSEQIAEPADAPEPEAAPPKLVTHSIDTVVAQPVPPQSDEPQADAAVEIAQTTARQEHNIRMQQLIDEGEYFLPIETSEERRSRLVIWFGILLIIVLCIAWYDVALDTSLLPNTYNLPHTNILRIHG